MATSAIEPVDTSSSSADIQAQHPPPPAAEENLSTTPQANKPDAASTSAEQHTSPLRRGLSVTILPSFIARKRTTSTPGADTGPETSQGSIQHPVTTAPQSTPVSGVEISPAVSMHTVRPREHSQEYKDRLGSGRGRTLSRGGAGEASSSTAVGDTGVITPDESDEEGSVVDELPGHPQQSYHHETSNQKGTRKRGSGVLVSVTDLARTMKLDPSLTLENSGSVARDHLASERTFLAYVRTSLAIASTGVALVQLFTISVARSDSSMSSRLQRFARPLGATTVVMGFLTLLIGFIRYFRIQSALVNGVFPPARQTVTFMACVLAMLVLVVFVVLVTVPRQ